MALPTQGFREALTALDIGEVDVIVTPETEAAEWAEANGYRVERGEMDGMAAYEIFPGAAGPASA